MQHHLDDQDVRLVLQEEHAAEDRENRQEDHQQRITHRLNSVTFLSGLDAPVAQQAEKCDDKSLQCELSGGKAQLVQLENQEHKGHHDEDHAEVGIVEEQCLQRLGGARRLGLYHTLGLLEWLLLESGVLLSRRE